MTAVTVTIAAISGKGGTGKTTTVINLGCALVERSRKVLAVDMDPQSNLTSGIGFDPYRLESTVFQVLTGETPNGTGILKSNFGLDVLPASPNLSVVEAALPSSIGREMLLRGALGRLGEAAEPYDYILIDTPPNFGFHTLSALAAADYVLIPVQMSGFAIKGLKEVLRTLSAARQRMNPEIRILGVLPTFVSPRTNFSRDMLDALRGLPNLSVFSVEVKSTVKLAETSLEGVPILNYASKSDAARSYRALADEVIERIEGRTH